MVRYSGSDLTGDSAGAALAAPLTYSSSDLTDITSKQIDLNSAAVNLKDVQLLESSSAEPLKIDKVLESIRVIIKLKFLSSFYHDLDDDNKRVKADFLSHAAKNESFKAMVETLSVFLRIKYYHLKKVKDKCRDGLYKITCETYYKKVDKLWSVYTDILIKALKDLIVQLHDQYQAPTCTDADKDKFYGLQACGTKVDTDDNDAAIKPGAVEICNDGKDNNSDGKIDCTDSACVNSSLCTQSTGVWKLVETVILRSSYESTRENICLGEGRDGETITLSGNSVTGHWYSFSKYCGNHFDVRGTINFDSPPAQVNPGTQVILHANGLQSGYQDCCFIGIVFNYYTGAGYIEGEVEGSSGYISLDLKTLPITQVHYSDNGSTRDGWQGAVNESETYTFTFPSSGSDFWCIARTNRGVGYAWHYQYQK